MNTESSHRLAARSWLTFRMRTLLAFVAFCAVFARIGGETAGYYAEQRVLSELRKYGDRLYYSDDLTALLC